MGKPRATQIAPQEDNLDLTFGFPGKLPVTQKKDDQQRLLRFFHNVAQGMGNRQAARAAGYSEAWAKRHYFTYIKKYPDFLQWLQAHYSQKAAKTIDVDQEQVLREMALIAFANEADYVVIEEVQVGNETVKRARRKRVDELTREQLTAVRVYNRPGHQYQSSGAPEVDWKWRNRDAFLQLVAKHLGMLNEKIILEHRHRHLHLQADLSKVPLEKLEALEAQFNKVLGYYEVEDAQRSVPAIRDHQGEVPRKGNGNGRSQDPGGEDH